MEIVHGMVLVDVMEMVMVEETEDKEELEELVVQVE